MAASTSESLSLLRLVFLALLIASSSWRARLEAWLVVLTLGRDETIEAVVEEALEEDVVAIVVVGG